MPDIVSTPSPGEVFAAGLTAPLPEYDRQKALEERVKALSAMSLGQLEQERKREEAAGTYDEDTEELFNALGESRALQQVEAWRDPQLSENYLITQYAEGLRDKAFTEDFRPVVESVVAEKIAQSKATPLSEDLRRKWDNKEEAVTGFVESMAKSALEIARTSGEGYTAPVMIALGRLANDKNLEDAAQDVGGRAGGKAVSFIPASTTESLGMLERGLPRVYDFIKASFLQGLAPQAAAGELARVAAGEGDATRMMKDREEADRNPESLKRFVDTRLKQELDLADIRRGEGKLAKFIGANKEALKARGIEYTEEDMTAAREAEPLADLTELLFFSTGATLVGKGAKALTVRTLKGAGMPGAAKVVEGTLAGAVPKTRILGRVVQTNEQLAEEALRYETLFRKTRIATGQATEKLGRAIKNAALPAGAPLAVGGTVLLAGGDMQDAATAALTTAGAKYLTGGRFGMRGVGAGLEKLGQAGQKTFSVNSPWEALRRGAIDLRRDIALASAAGTAEAAVYALDPGMTPEERMSSLIAGPLMATTGATSARVKDRFTYGLTFEPRLGTPEGIGGAPVSPATYGNTVTDTITARAFNKLSADSTRFVRSLMDFLGDKGRVHVVTTPEEYVQVYGDIAKGTSDFDNTGTQGVSLKPHMTKSGKAEVIINLSRGLSEAGGHEVTHAVLDTIEAAGGEGAAKLAAAKAAALKALGGVNSTTFKQIKDAYSQQFGSEVTDDYALNEWLAEHGSVVLAGLPLGKLGAERGVVENLYDALLSFSESMGLRVPGYSPNGTSPVTSSALPYAPSVNLLNTMEDIFRAFRSERDPLIEVAPPEPVAPAPVAAGVQNVEVVTPPAQPPGFKKGDPIGSISNPQGQLVFTGAKIWDDRQGPTVRIEGVDTNGNIVRADVPREWLQSPAATATPPVDVGATVPVPPVLVGQPATTPTTPAPAPVTPPAANPAPAPAPIVGGVTETQRQQLAGVPSAETQQENERVLSQNLGQAHEVVYSSAEESTPGSPADEQQRLKERQAREALEQEGIVNTLSRLYSKIVTPIKSRVAANGRTIVTGFSVDKFARNMNLVADWLIKNGRPEGAARIMSAEFAQDFLKYLQNQHNGYRGDGARIVRPEGWDPTLYPAENKDYTPQTISEDSRDMINFLMGFDPLSTNVRNAWVHKLAEQNGFVVQRSVPGKQGDKVYYNPLQKEMADAGFDVPLHKAVEELRVDRMASVAKVRTDLAAIKPAVTGSVQAGFMPEASKEPISTLRGRAQSLRHGAVITDYVKALVAADNATFMRELDATQTSLLSDIANHYQLPVDPSRGGRLGVLSAVRKELAFQRKRAVKPAVPQQVNVGLKIGDTVALTEQDVVKAFADEGLTLENVEVRGSATEPTVIASVADADKAKIYRIAEKLQQDAIALYNPVSDAGILVGPKAAAWGEFNKDFFLPLTEQKQFMPAPPVESEAFKKWFGDSKVLDADDQPLVVFHGTVSDFTKFDRRKANPESDFGAGFYFTNTPGDVAENYAGEGPDLQGKIERRAEQIAQEFDDKYGDSMEEHRAQAAREFKQHEGATMAAFLRMENPFVLGTDGKLRETYLEGRRLTNFVERLARSVDERDADKVREEIYTEIDPDGASAKDLIEAAKKSETLSYTEEPEEGLLISSELIRRAIEGAGFDGIIDYTVDEKFGSQKRIGKPMAGMNPDTIHYIAFKPTQIKSATGNIGTYSRRNPDIRYMPTKAEGSMGRKKLKFVNYSNNPNKKTLDPQFFGRSGVTPTSELSGRPRAYAYLKGSPLGQDKGLIDTRKFVHEGTVDGSKIYDGTADVLDYALIRNREQADQMLLDKGFIGIYREGQDGRQQIEFLEPVELTSSKENKPLVEDDVEAVSSLPALPLEDVDYQAMDAEFARKQAAGEPLYMPKASPKQETAFEGSVVRDEEGALQPMYHFTTASFDKFGKGDLGYRGTFDPTNPDIRYMPAKATNTPEFKEWSGGKPVYQAAEVDIENPPSRGVFEVYHGTKEDIATFKTKYSDELIFTTLNPEFAAEWARNRNRDGRSPRNYPKDVENADKAKADALRPLEGYDINPKPWEDYFNTREYREPGNAKIDSDTSVMKLYANVEKAFDPRKDYKLVEPLLRTMSGFEGILKQGSHKQGNWIVYENKSVVDLLKSKGYDAMWLTENVYDPKHETLAVFSNSQLKSATGNRGTFDSKNPDIRYMPEKAPLEDETLNAPAGPLAPRKNSAMALLYGKNPELKAPEGGQTNTGVAKQIMAAAIDVNGRKITSKDITPEEEELQANTVADEAGEALKQTGHAGNWYTKAIERMLKVARVIFPELADDAKAKAAGFPDAKRAELGLKVALAVTSQNLSVPDNARYAVEQFNILKETGRFDSSRTYGAKGEAISSNLELANTFVDKFGWEGLEAFIAKNFTVGDLSNALSSILGEEVTIAGRVDDIVQGAAIFGPKIGQGFLQNLLGNLFPVTVDLWLRRTWGRLTGDVMPDAVTSRQLAAMLDAYREEGLPLPPELRTLRVVTRNNKTGTRTYRDLTPESYKRILESAPVLESIDRAAEEHFSRWNRIYKDLRLGMDPQRVADYREGRMSMEEIVRRQRPVIRARERAWDRHVARSKRTGVKRGGKHDFLRQLDEREGRTAKLSNKDLSKGKPEWAKTTAVVFNSRKPIDVPTDQDRAVITRVINRARDILAERGINTTNADLQATIWYPEKDIWAKLRGENESDLKNSYDEEFLKIAQSRGLEDAARSALGELRIDQP